MFGKRSGSIWSRMEIDLLARPGLAPVLASRSLRLKLCLLSSLPDVLKHIGLFVMWRYGYDTVAENED